jgi:hypothetical protein
MADDTATPDAGEDDHGKAPTMDDLRTMVKDAVAAAIKPIEDKLAGHGGGGGGAPPDAASGAGGSNSGPPDISGMVDAALAKVLGDQDRKKSEDAHAAEHKRLAEAETKPVDRPARSRLLGNIWD